MAHLLQLKDEVDLTVQRRKSGSPTQVLDNGISPMSVSNEYDVSVEKQINVHMGPGVDVETMDVDNAPSGHTSTTANDTEMQKILASYEELNQKIRQYIPTQTSQSTPQ